ASSKTQVVLNWIASPTATSYHVERQGPSDTTFIEIAGPLPTTTFTDTNLVKGALYQYRVRAQNSGGYSDYSNVASASLPQGVTLDATVGIGANRIVRFIAADGTVTNIVIRGPGLATVDFAGDTITPTFLKGIEIVTGTNLVITSINTTGTNTHTVLSILSHGGKRTVNIGGFTSNGALGSILAPTTNLIGGLSVNGALNRLVLGSANDSAININGPLLAFQINSANSISVVSTTMIRNIQAVSWNSAGVISAPSIGSIIIKRDASFALNASIVHVIRIGGSLHDSTLTFSGAGAMDLTSLSVGSLVNSTLSSAGNLGAITAGNLLDSQIYAGARPAVNQSLPASATDLTAQDFIRSVSLRKHKGVVSDVNSSIAADRLNGLSLGTVQFSNNTIPFGAAAQLIAAVSATDAASGKSFNLHRLTDPTTVAAQLAAKGIAPRDFTLRIL
ncbi:MAG TPA: fibronectin type III domain-containing protein, partial [Tepidisphaeraceae bacterium]|nr:fibronectin type III domain-containing protein [Tepidisphaeraceae bacterium]